MVTIDSRFITLVVVISLPIVLRRLSAWYKNTSPVAPTNKPNRLTLPALQAPSDYIMALLVCAIVVHALTSAWHAPHDLFYATNQATNASTATLRAQVASKKWSEIGWHAKWGEEGLERILRRLSSWEGRKLYLLLGADPLLSCTFCSSPQDYINYALFTRTPWYGLYLFVTGIVTLPTAILSYIDAILMQLARKPTHNVNQRSDSRDRSHWRRPACWVLLVMLVVETSTLNSLANITGAGGWKDHWGMLLHIARHLLGATFILIIYLFPRRAEVAPITQIGLALRATVSHIEGALGLVQSALVSRYTVERDAGLREVSGQYWRTHSDSHEEQKSAHAGGVPAQVINEQRAAARLAARNLWLEAESNLLQHEADD